VNEQQTALIIGAGPAGLTAAYELLDKTDVLPLIFESSDAVGGISQTAVYQGNRIDIGGHRFFSKSDRVMQWWLNLFPLQGAPASDDRELGRQVPLADYCRVRPLGAAEAVSIKAPDPESCDHVMLVRGRLSRIFFLRKFFDYPITLSKTTLRNLGLTRIAKIGVSYLKTNLAPIKEERSLEDFFINRFGRELYLTFFKDYTEKVWGVPCRAIKPEWGAQRIRGLSVRRALGHALKKLLVKDAGVRQKEVETSLIEQFFYPKLGPGQLWEAVAEQVEARGGKIVRGAEVVGVETADGQVRALSVRDARTGEVTRYPGDYVISSMPVRDLVAAMGERVPEPVRRVAAGLQYRDFITVGLLLKKLAISGNGANKGGRGLVPDNWIYIQERDVKLGRLQIFNNWSPYLVADPSRVWIGLEYFCTEGDELWNKPADEFLSFAVGELTSIGIIDAADVLDGTVLRMPKAYPAYFGSYDDFPQVREFTDRFANLFLVGRNGMHRYNNMDHSMLTSMVAVENIAAGRTGKENIWSVNTESDYQESKET
jgi:protoporphyrinogen oxidase